MQFNDRVTVIFNTYNSFGEEVAGTAYQIICRIMKLTSKRKRADDTEVKDFDAELIVPGKNYAPYTQLLTDESAMFSINGILYSASEVEAIRDFSGKTKYYSIGLMECDPNET